MKKTAPEPYAVDCVSGKFICVRATSEENARERIVNEYKEEVKQIRKL